MLDLRKSDRNVASALEKFTLWGTIESLNSSWFWSQANLIWILDSKSISSIPIGQLLASLSLSFPNSSFSFFGSRCDLFKTTWQDFLGGPVVKKNLPDNTGETGLSPGPGRSHMPQGNEAHEPQILEALSSRAWAPRPERPPQWEARPP